MIGVVRTAWMAAALSALSALSLSGCGDPAKAPARDHATAEAPAVAGEEPERRDYASRETGEDRRDRTEAREDRPDPRDLPTPTLDGRPMWTATSRLTSEENAERAFEAHGAEFGDKSTEAYVRRVHAFLEAPPADVLTLTRANGDKLYYSEAQNVFAVAREDGAPRTLFKPEEGIGYWREQETREEERADGGSRRERGSRG